MAIELSRQQARRIAVRAQLLTAQRPTTMLEVIRHLTFLQADPTNAVAPNADLVLWSRLGSACDPRELATATGNGTLLELHMLLRPREDLALFRAGMAAWESRTDLREWEEDVREWVAANDDCRRDIRERLEAEGPLPLAQLPDTCNVPWRSSGWTNNKNLDRLLTLMVSRGEVAIAGRNGRERLFDLAERVYPEEVVPQERARQVRAERELAALGIMRGGTAGQPATVEGVRGTWRVDASYLDDDFAGRTVLLSPLDRLVFDRKRLTEIFEFDYQLEMYKPAAKRKWGYWAMPILHGDRLVGKVDATADRVAGVLRVDAIHWDEPVPERAVQAELRDLAKWLKLKLMA
ncbi:DNA glycosylase AlkZ-like family protein [Actinoplanes sp. TFC3]|uniref:DNA glycosylase AlkZ-like family protein n=1 Tax=Actinoplanes sp. TFC3 TaxID=1710355 RepID=UPI000832E19A|nr:crosslink repair DNA glycosylase YcaQ family protein [Actinoplanes sp. TFC3]